MSVDGTRSNRGRRSAASRSRSSKIAEMTTDDGLVLRVLWIAVPVSAVVSSMVWWFAPFDSQAGTVSLLIMVALTVALLPLGFCSWARRAWLITLRSSGTLEQRKIARRLARKWKKLVPKLFVAQRDALDRKKFWYPGLKDMYIDRDGVLCIVLKLPATTFDQTDYLEKRAKNGYFAQRLNVYKVEYLPFEGDEVTYRIIPTDHTRETRRVHVG